MSSVRTILKKIPGLRRLYRSLSRRRAWLHRAIHGPSRGEIYDIQTFDVFRRVLQPDSVCIDVGANVGAILREMLAVAPRARHHAIEALPHLASRLKSEFPSVAIHGCAVANRAGRASFNFVENDCAYSGLRRRRYDRRDPVIREISVPVQRIDDLVPAETPVRLIKMDIEGGEYDALLGARETLRRCKPVIVFEFGLGAADYYGITPQMIFSYLCGDIGLHISTMERWLSGKSPYDLARFTEAFEKGEDFYYIAYP